MDKLRGYYSKLPEWVTYNPDNEIPPEWVNEIMLKEFEKMGLKQKSIIITSTPNDKRGYFWDLWEDEK